MAKEGFKITDGKGFQITFDNGVTVSVQFGIGNYCENRDTKIKDYSFIEKNRMLGEIGSENAEVAIWDKEGNWISRECPYMDKDDNVAGWISPEELLKILEWASNYSPSKEDDIYIEIKEVQ